MKRKNNNIEAKDVTEDFENLYHPKSALVFYESDDKLSDMYVEYFDMDEDGSPINAHPLTTNEAKYLAKRLKIQNCREKEFLKPQGIISSNILLIDNSENAKVIWYTEFSERELYFSKDLEIPNGTAKVPSLIWCADKLHLKIFAVDYNQRPTEETSLYHAPFFNIYDNGSVCMGNVDTKIKKSASLEEFTATWERFFFNSYFSHLMYNHNPIKGNCVSLWKDLVQNRKDFPNDVLIKSNLKLKNLL